MHIFFFFLYFSSKDGEGFRKAMDKILKTILLGKNWLISGIIVVSVLIISFLIMLPNFTFSFASEDLSREESTITEYILANEEIKKAVGDSLNPVLVYSESNLFSDRINGTSCYRVSGSKGIKYFQIAWMQKHLPGEKPIVIECKADPNRNK